MEHFIYAEALGDIASALNSTLNFEEVLARILDNVGKVVPHKSSNIMLIDDDCDTARIVAAQGYEELGLSQFKDRITLSIKDTESFFQMYSTGEPLIISDTRLVPGWINLPETSWILSYAASPIKIKKNIIGFLNLNSPIPGFFSQLTARRLMAFADQAGVALTNARLLLDLQRSNQELTQAYAITLQGWSKALELRDYETEGHSQRVVQLTIDLATEMGIFEPDLTDIRYGVILHDIGKIGIPDYVLSKPGPLSEEEWAIMRLHPEYARQMLESVPYLSKAMEIPYCHHERWDGSGYPQGLHGSEIPIAARIFSVVDVWDALRSDRPYNARWSFSDAYEYIKSQAGKAFDPVIVSAFLRIVSKIEEVNEPYPEQG